MGVIPGNKSGGRPRIGERVVLTVPFDVLKRVDAVVHAANCLYVRPPRVFRSRQSVLRAAVAGGLPGLEGRIRAREMRVKGNENS